MLAGKEVSRFEIFVEFVNRLKTETAKKEAIMEELAMELESNKGIAAMGLKDADDHNKESDFETFIYNSFIDAFYDDFDVSLANLFEADDLFFSKVDAIKYEFAYLCDVFPNGYSICNDHFMYMFDINFVLLNLRGKTVIFYGYK